MSEIVISVENLSKRYTLGHQRNTDDGFRHVVEEAIRSPLQWFRQRTERQRQASEEFWALRDVNFEVKRGDVVGIIGRNGAGKSTLFKILSRITEPTKGRIQIDGRVASLLEVGTGFHPELTGRENIFLNGAILGMSRVEIKRKFDEIVAFSEVEKFLDTPVKRYSSGMYVRLAFSVAAHLEPEILIVDEVLAVGDVQFQNKCLGKMQDVSSSGRTVLFVSHNMQAVATLCRRAIWMHHGQLKAADDARTLVGQYLAASGNESAAVVPLRKKTRTGTGAARFVEMSISRPDQRQSDPEPFVSGESVTIDLTIEATAEIKEANVAVVLYDETGFRLIDANTALKGRFFSLPAGGTGSVTFHLENLLLKPGRYGVELWLGRGGVEEIDYVRNAGALEFTHDAATARHTETFPGPYQCRFDLSVQL